MSHDNHVAIAPAAPVEAVYRLRDGREWSDPVHGFTYDGRALVAHSPSGSLIPATHPQKQFVGLRASLPSHPEGPFTPAPDGMVAHFRDGGVQQLRWYDRYGRPVLLDNQPTSRAFYLAADDENLQAIVGPQDDIDLNRPSTPDPQ
ncbi:hypothetical protein [Pseudonocardia sp. HH130630-07]|uniref:hypothetical protein n=1 Tax=Pseudonocardia sp. HH130630-07 TaxID=1690815 RepID=UPI000815148D|nr:hypothetical protein [Pseudonocardia sp. HH130630-07]ANY06941.1 hypothetical protein AFB00_12290 [Pseudonocardia sp. HH130630-07]